MYKHAWYHSSQPVQQHIIITFPFYRWAKENCKRLNQLAQSHTAYKWQLGSGPKAISRGHALTSLKEIPLKWYPEFTLAQRDERDGQLFQITDESRPGISVIWAKSITNVLYSRMSSSLQYLDQHSMWPMVIPERTTYSDQLNQDRTEQVIQNNTVVKAMTPLKWFP